MGLLGSGPTFVDVGEVSSVSVVVDVDKLLDEDGNAGAEKVLDTVEMTEPCESGKSGWGAAIPEGV